VGKVLEFAGCVERLQRFQESLQAAEPIFPVLLLLIGENSTAPEDQFGNARLGSDNLAEKLSSALLNPCYAFITVRRVDNEPLWYVEQVAQILECPSGKSRGRSMCLNSVTSAMPTFAN
jgi:hypothetical protein